jgi:hypothetical protein
MKWPKDYKPGVNPVGPDRENNIHMINSTHCPFYIFTSINNQAMRTETEEENSQVGDK